MPKMLSQVLAVERTVKKKIEDEFTKLHQEVQKSELVNGFHKSYEPKEEGGELQPPATKRVTVRADETVKRMRKILTDLFDITAQKDATNCVAKSDVVLPDGHKLLTQVPATHLLWLEKKLVDVATFVKKLPTLDPAEIWKEDKGLGLFVTEPKRTNSTKQIHKHIVVVPATPQHPAQVKDDTENVVAGTWTHTAQSGALPYDKVLGMAERVEVIQRAVKEARDQANRVEVMPLSTGEKILGYIFG